MRLILIPLAALALAGCDAIDSPKTQAEAAAIKLDAQTRADCQRKSSEAQIASQKHFEAVQDQVVKACIAKGGLPVIGGGSVNCRKEPQ